MLMLSFRGQIKLEPQSALPHRIEQMALLSHKDAEEKNTRVLMVSSHL